MKFDNFDEMFIMQVMCIGCHFDALRLIWMKVVNLDEMFVI